MGKCGMSLGRRRPCKTSIGGLKKVYIGSFLPFKSREVIITDLILTQIPEFNVYEFATLGDPSFEQTMRDDDGGKHYEQSISFDLSYESFAINNELQSFLDKEWFMILEDKAGNKRVLGLFNGVTCSKLTYNTGGSKGEPNSITFEWEAMEYDPAPFITGTLADVGIIIGDLGNYILTETGIEIGLESDGSGILLES